MGTLRHCSGGFSERKNVSELDATARKLHFVRWTERVVRFVPEEGRKDFIHGTFPDLGPDQLAVRWNQILHAQNLLPA